MNTEGSPLSTENLEKQLKSKVHLLFGEDRLTPNTRESGENEFDSLSNEIQESEGKLMVLVHPFYEEYAGIPREYINEMQKTTVLQEMLRGCNEKIGKVLEDAHRMPLVILEDRHNLDALVNHCLATGTTLPRDCYLIPTFESMGTLFLEPPKDSDEKIDNLHPTVIEDYRKRVSGMNMNHPLTSKVMEHVSLKYKVRTWSYITAILKNIGVKEIYMGGKFLDAHEDEVGDLNLTRCLGEAYDYMDAMTKGLGGLKVELTDMTFPLQEKEIEGVKTLSQIVNGKEEK